MQKINFVLSGTAISYIQNEGGKYLSFDFNPPHLQIFNEKKMSSRHISNIKLDQILNNHVLTGLSENNTQYVVPLANIDRIEASSFSSTGSNWTVYVTGEF